MMELKNHWKLLMCLIISTSIFIYDKFGWYSECNSILSLQAGIAFQDAQQKKSQSLLVKLWKKDPVTICVRAPGSLPDIQIFN